MNKIKEHYFRVKREIERLCPNYKKYLPYIIAALVVFSIWQYGQIKDKETHVFHQKETVNIEGGRILDSGKAIYERKEKIVSNRLGKVEKSLDTLTNTFTKINEQLAANQAALDSLQKTSKDKEASKEVDSPNLEKDQEKGGGNKSPQKQVDEITLDDPPSNLKVGPAHTSYGALDSFEGVRPLKVSKRKRFARKVPRGPSVISFPVQSSKAPERMGVKVPSGSYLKAKLLTGVEASESRPVPVLLQADYFFVGPNRSKIDLSSCFIIAKSKGNLSIERVEMQVTKISCVSKSGKMFERELNGFVADGKDSSFGIEGIVNSKQSRVASMAFLSSVVQGIGNAIQQAQTTTQTNALGGSSSIVTGSQAKYLAAGGASNAASLVTNWYLKHAQNLLPTINVGSGQDVWIILQDTVDLPNWYFKRPKGLSQNSGSYFYLSRLTD
ncbi:TraB/VirB10 family protein [Halobacteriovorax sp. DA5]|uniref:TraB/VirB10 family protein n=1 Tax=Halobacteriovorax sp. DA5 TaxID=2067553 RepID=UPI000CD061D8|nr:TraB/VirB10 family protein [Halobacteriovorax sp. DA5]POB14808.1 hypothetical protein C0Z22_00105 [Halobacteriovorax sp. DA5]